MRHAPLVLIAMVAGLAIPSAQAATLTWGTSGTGGSGTWSDAGLWSGSTWSNANNDDAWFTGTPGTVTLTQAQTANSLTFDSFTGTYAIGTAGQTLTINGGGLTLNSGAGAVTISSPVTLGAAQTWTNNSSSLLTAAGDVTNGGNLLTVAGSGSTTVSGGIAGTGGLTKSGAGTLTLTGTTTYSGSTTVSSGTLAVANAGRMGSSGSYSGAISLAANSALVYASTTNQTLGGVISGSGSLVLRSATNTLTLNNANTLTGPITVSSGTLLLGNSSAGGAGGIVLGDASTGTNPVAVVSNVGITSPANITVSALGTGSATIGSSGGSAAVSYSGTLTLNRATTLVGLNSDRTSFLSKITGNVGTLTIGGNQRITLHGATNDFVGDVVVASGGILQLSVAGVIPDAAAVTLNGSGGLYFANGITETIGSLTGGTAAVVSLWSGVTGLNTLAAGFNNASTTFAGSMTNGPGTLAFTKIGTGTQTLSGANTYTGATTVSGGVLRIGDGGTTGSLSASTAISVSSTATLAFQRSDTITVSNAISGAGGLAQLGSGTLALTGSNTYSGTTTISAGTLQIGSSGTTGSLATSSAITGSAGATFAFNRSNTVTQGSDFSNVIGGAINVGQIGSGTLVLSASNTYTGTTSALAGTIVATGTGSLPGFSNAGLVVINGGTLAVRTGGSGWTTGQVDTLLANATKTAGSFGIDTTNGNLTQGAAFTTTNLGPLVLVKLGANSLTLTATNTFTGATIVSSGTLVVGDGATAGSIGSTSGVSVASGATLAFNRTDNYGGNFTPAISGSGGIRLQGGSLTLPNANTYAAGSIVSSGTLALGNATAAGTGTITLGDASTGSSNVQLTIASGVDRSGFTNAITVSSQGTGNATLKFNEAAGFTGFTGSGTITLNRAATFDATGLSSGYYQFAHPLSGTGAMTLTNSNGVRFILTGTSSGYTGDITVQSGGVFEPYGMLTAASGNNVTIQSGAAMSIQFYASSIGALLGSGTVQSVFGAATLTVGKGDASGTFSGIMRDNGTTLSFTKTGSGTQTLTGSSSYTGATTVSAGVLRIGDGGTTGSLSASTAISVSSGATLAFQRSDAFTMSNTISGAGGAAQLGSGTLTLSGNNTYSGTTTVSAGVLTAGGSSAFGSGSPLVVNAGALNLGGFAIAVGSLSGSSGATITTAAASGTATLTTSFTTGTATYAGSIADNGSGVVAINKSGNGTLVLAGNNTYTAATTVSAGVLQVGAGGTTGSLAGSTAIGVSSGATLAFQRSDALPVSNTISGAGSVTQLGSGTLTLSGNNSFSGQLTVATGAVAVATVNDQSTNGPLGNSASAVVLGSSGSRGTLAYTGVTGTGSKAFSLATGGTGAFDVPGGATLTLSGGISGSGGLVKDGPGTLAFSTQKTYTGTTTINAGVLDLAGGGGGGSGVIRGTATVNLGGELRLSTGDATGYNTGAASLTTINLVGGVLNVNTTSNQTLGGAAIVLTGGTITGVAGSNLDFFQGSSTITTLASAAQSTINDAQVRIRQTEGLTISVADGAAGSDLVISSTIANQSAFTSAPLIKAGAGTLALTGVNTYTGTTVINAGTLLVGNGGTAGSIGSTSGVSVASGATLAFNRTDSYGGTFNRVVSGSGGIRVLAGKLTFGGSNTYSGSTVVAGGTLAPSAATALGQSALILAGAAPGDGGVLDVTSLGSGLSVANGQKLGGYGTILGDVTIAGGAIVSPGGSIGPLTNTGTQTWGPAGRYLFEITNANGDGSYAGSRWDLLTVSNLLITATSNNPFIVDLQSLTNPTDQSPGAMVEGNWDPNSSYQWKFLVADTTTFTAANFDTSWFTVSASTTSFLNPTNGSFYVARGGGNGGLGGSTAANELYIVYAAVPEPGTLVLAGLGLAGLFAAAARRRRG